jgi:hypothetical protein
MTLTPRERKQVDAFIQSLPGKRGIDVPADIHDVITTVGNGIARPLWGRGLSPEQIQWLFDNGKHTPSDIHDAMGQLPHPHAPNLKISEYQQYAAAHRVFTEHQQQSKGGKR